MKIDFKIITEKMDRWRLPLFVFITSLYSVVFYAGKMNEFPSYIHLWTQADRYALALGYIDNNFDLLHPQTQNLRPDDYVQPIVEKGITSVDLPIHEFIIAAIMKLLGTTAPWVFKFYNLLYGLVGLYFLMLLVKKMTGKVEYAFLSFMLVMVSPVYTYYLPGFITSMTSLSNLFISLFFYYSYIKEGRKRSFWFFLLFITISTVSRFTYLVYLLAMLGGLFWNVLKEKRVLFYELVGGIISLSIIGICVWHKNNLSRLYGSMFLNDLMPPKDFTNLKEIISDSLKKWKWHYATEVQYYLLLFVFVLAIYCLFKYKKTSFSSWSIMVILTFFGVFAFFIAMARQYINHDYYILDSFIPLTILLLISSIVTISRTTAKLNKMFLVVFVLGVILSFKADYKRQKDRCSLYDWDCFTINKNDFIGSSKFLDSVGIPRSAKMLVIKSASPNASLLMMERKGYTVLDDNPEYLHRALTWNWDYMVIQNRYILSDILPKYPEFLKDFERVNANNLITVYKRDIQKRDKSIEEFIGAKVGNPIMDFSNDFSNNNLKNWSNVKLSETVKSQDGKQACIVDSNSEYGVLFKYHDNLNILASGKMISFEGEFFKKEDVGNLSLVVCIELKGEKLLYKYICLNNLLTINTWKKIYLTFPYDIKRDLDDADLSVYLWNNSKKEIYYDNFRIAVN